MKHIIYILALFLLASCNDDKGNYDYKDINTVGVSLEKIYSYRLEKDTTVVITPTLEQSLQKNRDNLTYVWLHSTTNHNFYGHGNFDTVSTNADLRFHIDPEDKKLAYDHYFRLNVLDKETGIEYPVNTTIKLVKPYDGAWMVLHARNSQTELGAIEYMGDEIMVTEDAYHKETGKQLLGKPLCLGQVKGSVKYYGSGANIFSIITDIPREAGVYCQWKKFQKMDSMERMVAPTIRSSFDYRHVEMLEAGASYGGVCLSNGVLYQIPSGMKIYKPNTALEGNVKITKASKVAFASYVYDEAGHRFAFYSNTNSASFEPTIFNEQKENSAQVKPIPVRDGNIQAVDPNNLPADQKVLYLGAGYQFDPEYNWGVYGYGLTVKGQDSCFVYELNMAGTANVNAHPAFQGYYRLKMPKGLDENSCFASTRVYSGILFYASGNTVYRLDFKQSGGKATAIYTHTGGKATRMRFARKENVDDMDELYKSYEFNLNRSLGISFDMGSGKSDFVILNLSETGTVGADSKSYPAKQVYTTFGEITDFVFL